MKKAGQSIKAVVFDLDGTLLRTEHLQWKGWNIALKSCGLRHRITKKEYRKYCGRSGHEIEKEIIASFNLRLRPGALLSKKERFLHSHFSREPLHWARGARAALSFFKRRGLPIALATGGKRNEMIKKLRKLNAHLHFDALACLSDVRHGKPHPDIYLLACRRLGVSPKNAIAFEDTESGVQSASRAGLRVIAIPTPYSSGQSFSKAWARCKSFKQAVAMLKPMLKKSVPRR